MARAEVHRDGALARCGKRQKQARQMMAWGTAHQPIGVCHLRPRKAQQTEHIRLAQVAIIEPNLEVMQTDRCPRSNNIQSPQVCEQSGDRAWPFPQALQQRPERLHGRRVASEGGRLPQHAQHVLGTTGGAREPAARARASASGSGGGQGSHTEGQGEEGRDHNTHRCKVTHLALVRALRLGHPANGWREYRHHGNGGDVP
mmetsp:Transcript_65608/g.212369  ORF Transcript_65608/g.212369 Transcript_65608/m.212369 type:complete len:201 (+) Transcript_65608:753-1355(+)